MKKLSLLFTSCFILFNSYSQEICDNGIDDDGDGQIDLNDTDCSCVGFNSVSLIPNPSFELMSSCPTSYSQVSNATGWDQATSATADYFNCSFSFAAADSAGLIPYPDGNGIMGTIFTNGWQEYLGACLVQPIISNQIYVLDITIASTPINGTGNFCNGGIIFYDSIDITLFGSPVCDTFPIDSVGCPSNLSVIGSVSYLPTSSWSTISMIVNSPIDINSIVLGSPCVLPAVYDSATACYPYFYYDNLILRAPDSSSYQINVVSSGSLCFNDLILEAFSDTSGGSFQWYYEGVAIANEIGNMLDVSSTVNAAGNYQIVQTIGGNCQSTSHFLVDSIGSVNDCSTGVTVLDEAELFNIYPNPASSQIFVSKKIDSPYKMEISVLSIDGKIIKQIPLTESNIISIEISDLSVGLYFLKINHPSGNVIKSFVKK